jgi:hypothetical protein
MTLSWLDKSKLHGDHSSRQSSHQVLVTEYTPSSGRSPQTCLMFPLAGQVSEDLRPIRSIRSDLPKGSTPCSNLTRFSRVSKQVFEDLSRFNQGRLPISALRFASMWLHLGRLARGGRRGFGSELVLIQSGYPVTVDQK